LSSAPRLINPHPQTRSLHRYRNRWAIRAEVVLVGSKLEL
jgi:hypothetical protein